MIQNFQPNNMVNAPFTLRTKVGIVGMVVDPDGVLFGAAGLANWSLGSDLGDSVLYKIGAMTFDYDGVLRITFGTPASRQFQWDDTGLAYWHSGSLITKIFDGFGNIGDGNTVGTFSSVNSNGDINSSSAVNGQQFLAGGFLIADGAGNTYIHEATVPPPVSATLGAKGQILYSAGFLYICIATNTWRRVAIAAF